MLSESVKTSIEKSVLCWLATADKSGQPNVSPKEIFTHFEDQILVANIASPNTVNNILSNPKVSLSFIGILVQKGYQVYGEAKVVNSEDNRYRDFEKCLKPMLGDKFVMKGIIVIQPIKIRPILAPSYQFYPETTKEEEQIASARKQYGL